MPQIIDYVWTEQDQDIWAGNTAGSAQGPFVSPYGIRADKVKFPPERGHSIDLDLAWSLGGEVGRANRFYVADGWVGEHVRRREWTCGEGTPDHPGREDKMLGFHTYEWVEWDIPGGVETLGQLCDHLIQTDSDQFPKAIYGNRAPRKWNTNAAIMLFDYWGNSRFRYATSAEGFNWDGNYLSKPDDIKVVAPTGEKLKWVLRHKTITPPTPAPPAKSGDSRSAGAGGSVLDDLITTRYASGELEKRVDAYIAALEACNDMMKWLSDVSDAVMKRRSVVLRSASGIRAAAFVSTLSAPRGDDDAVEIVALLDGVLPDARDWLMRQPVAQTDRAPMQSLPDTDLVLGGEMVHQTHNAAASMAGEVEKLDALLFGTYWLDVIQAWNARVVDELQGYTLPIDWNAVKRAAEAKGDATNDPTLDLLARQSRLESAVASAVGWYGEAAFPRDGSTRPIRTSADGLNALFDDARDSHATSVAELGGASPLEAAIKLTGKFYSFGKSISKIGVALLRTCVSWDAMRLAKSALQTGGSAAAKTFADSILARLPDLDFDAVDEVDKVSLRTEAKLAIKEGDKGAARKLATKIAKKSVREAAAWKNVCGVLNVLNLMVALGTATTPSDPMVASVNWLAQKVEVVDVVLGSAGKLLSALGGFEGVVAKLEALGTHVGVIGALLAFTQGGIGLIDALIAPKIDPGAVVRSSVLFAGGAATLFTVAATYFGIATGGVGFAIEVFGIACLMSVGAIDLGRMIMKDSLFVEAMKKLVVDLRHEPEWSALERAKLDVRETMTRVEGCAAGTRGLFPGANVMNHWRHLRANGFSDAAIINLLSVGAATGPLDADSTWEAAPNEV